MAPKHPREGWCMIEIRRTLHTLVKGRDRLGFRSNRIGNDSDWTLFHTNRLNMGIPTCVSCFEEFKYGP